VQTSFAIISDRAAVFVQVTGTEGAQGWGEVWRVAMTKARESEASAHPRPVKKSAKETK
jgi:L-alanine-DL-glutamate epimerase-like enolase superfamily enzyme